MHQLRASTLFVWRSGVGRTVVPQKGSCVCLRVLVRKCLRVCIDVQGCKWCLTWRNFLHRHILAWQTLRYVARFDVQNVAQQLVQDCGIEVVSGKRQPLPYVLFFFVCKFVLFVCVCV